MTAPFDVFTAPLADVNLIEASAGTGKTWNICGVYMRLLLERNLPVSQLLVVTFTNTECHPAFAAHLTTIKDSPGSWAARLRKRIAKPLARVQWPEDIDRMPVIDSRAVERAFANARATWSRSRTDIAGTLLDGIAG